MELNREDPGPAPVLPQQVQRTLAKLRAEPSRGRAVVCEIDGSVVGYALLISFWSNELGGEVCVIDELFVDRKNRGRGLATALFDRLAAFEFWFPRPMALVLEVSPENERARALYERLGFRGRNVGMRRLLSAC
jgi:RimJ/RimL family protein N-acetyltransferase